MLLGKLNSVIFNHLMNLGLVRKKSLSLKMNNLRNKNNFSKNYIKIVEIFKVKDAIRNND